MRKHRRLICLHWESNPRPTAYKAGALPTELWRQNTPGGGRTHGLPLRRRTRYPLRYRSSVPLGGQSAFSGTQPFKFTAPGGASSGACSGDS